MVASWFLLLTETTSKIIDVRLKAQAILTVTVTENIIAITLIM